MERPHNHSQSASQKTWKELIDLGHSRQFEEEEQEEEEDEDHFHDDHNHLGEDGFFCGSGPGMC